MQRRNDYFLKFETKSEITSTKSYKIRFYLSFNIFRIRGVIFLQIIKLTPCTHFELPVFRCFVRVEINKTIKL